ncbi:hypothetical protein [Dictyobacter formicarum]|uniref:Phosphotyrosine protein phosphatase I domain-containing protein n=1 Tax=Dictyobacter formicarum TaxID=2778368 RepID=A0ABQ3VN47_9CHLR|nr:hypothetical protein [Dictyobacter formicarum]GHO87659.1 hypothetical protein KSZ_56650 [Dictyobacter formicarum]
MNEHRKRVLFLCAHRSVRALMAASLLTARVHGPWDIWSTPLQENGQELDLAHQVLDEVGIPLLASPQTTEPDFGLSWNEGTHVLRNKIHILLQYPHRLVQWSRFFLVTSEKHLFLKETGEQ